MSRKNVPLVDWWTPAYAAAGAGTWLATGMGTTWYVHAAVFGGMVVADTLVGREISLGNALVDLGAYWIGGIALVWGIAGAKKAMSRKAKPAYMAAPPRGLASR